jgi:hypothetical protein
VNVELNDDGAIGIYKDAFVIAYMQACETLIRLTTKEHEQLCIGPRHFNGKVVPSYRCGMMDECG